MRTKAKFPQPETEQLCRRIEKWRASPSRGRSMPEEVWVAAVALAEVHGAYATSKRVEIGYDGLRSRLSMPETRSRLGVKRRAKSAAPSFIDLPAPTLFGGSLAQTTVEVTRRDGAKLAMRLGTADARDVMGLVREFLGGRS